MTGRVTPRARSLRTSPGRTRVFDSLRDDENAGVTSARNEAWRQARAPYVAVLDSDDVALPERLSRQVEYLDAHPSVAAVGGAVITVDSRGRRFATRHFATSDSAIRSTLERKSPLAHPAVLLRRSALEEVGGYRLDRAEDYDLWLRLSERWNLANLAAPVTLYRLHPRQMSVRTLESQTWGRLVAQVAARDRRAGRRDPLEGVEVVDPRLLSELRVDPAEVATAVENDRLHWASLLAALGYEETATELLGRVPHHPRRGSGERLRSGNRPPTCGTESELRKAPRRRPARAARSTVRASLHLAAPDHEADQGLLNFAACHGSSGSGEPYQPRLRAREASGALVPTPARKMNGDPVAILAVIHQPCPSVVLSSSPSSAPNVRTGRNRL